MGLRNYRQIDSFRIQDYFYKKEEQSDNYIVWALYDNEDNFEAWEIWTTKNGIWYKPKLEDFGKTAWYVQRPCDILFWKKEINRQASKTNSKK